MVEYLAAVKDEFTFIDKDRDGVLSEVEHITHCGYEIKSHYDAPADCQELHRQADLDQDGHLTRTEFYEMLRLEKTGVVFYEDLDEM